MVCGPVKPASPGGAARSGNMSSLVVRAWIEQGAPARLGVRVVEIVPGGGERPIIVTTSVSEACRAVRGWLEGFQP
jgi:hypothetical protein